MSMDDFKHYLARIQRQKTTSQEIGLLLTLYLNQEAAARGMGRDAIMPLAGISSPHAFYKAVQRLKQKGVLRVDSGHTTFRYFLTPDAA